MHRYRKASGALLAVVCLTTLSSPLMTNPVQASATATASPWTVYTVSMQSNTAGDLVSINGKTGAIESSIAFVAADPKNLFISPDGSHAYLLNNTPYITVLHLTGDKPQSAIQLEGTPNAMAIAPDGKTGYVTVGQSVFSADLFSNQTQKLASFVSPPYGVAVSPDGKTLYVATASTADNSVSTMQLVPINLASKTPLTPINLGTGVGLPASMNVSPDGNTAYVNASPLKIVNLKTGAVKTVLMGVQGPYGHDNIAIDPHGQYVYGENAGWSEVSSLNLKTDQTDDLMSNGPYEDNLMKGLAIAPDGSKLYVSFYAGQDVNRTFDGGIQVLSTSASGPHKGYLLGTIPQGPDIIKPLGLTGIVAVAPDQAPHASFTVTTAPVGQTTVFDASSSYGDSSITKYAWNFGDGTTIVSSQPTVTHTYRKADNYTVTLTETDEMGATVNNPVVFDGQRVEVNAGSSTAETSRPVKIANEMLSVTFQYGVASHLYHVQPAIFSIDATSPWLDLYGLSGHPYHAQFTVLDGTAPYHWRVRSGTVPKGLTFNTKTGLLSGTPKEPWNSYFTISATDAHGIVSSSFISLSFFGTGASESAVYLDGGSPDYIPVVVQRDPVHKDLTTYISLGGLELDLARLGIQASWNGKTLSLITPNTFTVTGADTGTHPYSIWINGLKVETFPNVGKTPQEFPSDTFVPIYYLMAALKHVQGLRQTWDGTTWSLTS